MSEGSLLPPCQRGSSPSHCIEPFLPCLCKPAITLSPGQAGSPYLHMNACAVTQLSPLAQPMLCAAHLCTEGDSSRDSGFSRTQGCQRVSKSVEPRVEAVTSEVRTAWPQHTSFGHPKTVLLDRLTDLQTKNEGLQCVPDTLDAWESHDMKFIEHPWIAIHMNGRVGPSCSPLFCGFLTIPTIQKENGLKLCMMVFPVSCFREIQHGQGSKDESHTRSTFNSLD